MVIAILGKVAGNYFWETGDIQSEGIHRMEKGIKLTIWPQLTVRMKSRHSYKADKHESRSVSHT